MFHAPLCIDQLEDRLNTNIEHFQTRGRHRTIFHVQANCSRGIEGLGSTLEDACHDLLLKMGLERPH
jgi:hypothetical protein